MVSGPLMFLSDALPITIRPSIFTVNTESSQVLTAACVNASAGA